MTYRRFPLGMLLACVLLSPGLGACGGRPGQHVMIDVPDASAPTAEVLVGREVGRLLSGDRARSDAALGRLTTLDAAGVAALEAHAGRIPAERDPRWLLVLDENHLFPALTPDEEIDYLVWKVDRREPFYVVKAQNRLLDLAGRDPDAVAGRLGGEGTEALAVALAVQGGTKSVPRLLARYRTAETDAERSALAEALTHVVGEDLRPRGRGTPDEIREDAGRVRRWYEQHGAESDG